MTLTRAAREAQLQKGNESFLAGVGFSSEPREWAYATFTNFNDCSTSDIGSITIHFIQSVYFYFNFMFLYYRNKNFY